jgi:hypothetical protein
MSVRVSGSAGMRPVYRCGGTKLVYVSYAVREAIAYLFWGNISYFQLDADFAAQCRPACRSKTVLKRPRSAAEVNHLHIRALGHVEGVASDLSMNDLVPMVQNLQTLHTSNCKVLPKMLARTVGAAISRQEKIC